MAINMNDKYDCDILLDLIAISGDMFVNLMKNVKSIIDDGESQVTVNETVLAILDVKRKHINVQNYVVIWSIFKSI